MVKHEHQADRMLGGFAHVYLVKLTQVVDGTDVAVLKRVAVPDKESLASMRVEVETMVCPFKSCGMPAE